VDTSGVGRDNYTAKISLSQNLFAGFGSQAKVAESEASKVSVAASREAVRAKVSYDLKAAVANLIYAEQAVRLSREIIGRRENNLSLVELRFEGGRENSGSVAFSRSLLADAKYQEQEALQSLVTARTTLARVLGRDSSEGLEGAASTALAVPLVEPPLKPDLRLLVTETPEYRIATANAQAASARVGQARAKFLPTVDLVGAFGKSDDRFFPQQDEWSATLSVKVPLFTGGSNYFGLQSAASSRTAAEANQADTTRKVLVDLQSAHNAFVLANSKLKVDSDFVAASRSRAEIARQKYDNGLLSFENWDIIETELISRERAFLQSRRDRTLSEAAWEKALGQSVF
jgi:outer membrane protein TolC